MENREEIINDIQRFVGGQREYAERAADWIIRDRDRICGPLVDSINSILVQYNPPILKIYKEVLKRAGLEK